MGNVIAFANNQVMVAKDPTLSVITTDPVPMRDNDRITPTLSVDYMFNGDGSDGLTYVAEVSMDGTTWADSTVTGTAVAPGVTAGAPTVVPAAFVRFRFEFKAASSSIGGVGFDLHVLLDHE